MCVLHGRNDVMATNAAQYEIMYYNIIWMGCEIPGIDPFVMSVYIYTRRYFGKFQFDVVSKNNVSEGNKFYFLSFIAL